MVYRAITPLMAGVEIVGLGLALPNDVELCAHFNPFCGTFGSGRAQRAVRPAMPYQTTKTTPKKRGVAKGGRHGKQQYLEAD